MNIEKNNNRKSIIILKLITVLMEDVRLTCKMADISMLIKMSFP